jgi:hypothetical protein
LDMSPVPFTPRLRRLLLSGMLAGIAAVAVSGPSSPAFAQANPYCYAPYYNPYYCQYYSYYYGYGYPSYGYSRPAYPYYGSGFAAPFAFGLGFGFGGGHYVHREVRAGVHRRFVGRALHGGARFGFHRVPHGFAGGAFHPVPHSFAGGAGHPAGHPGGFHGHPGVFHRDGRHPR